MKRRKRRGCPPVVVQKIKEMLKLTPTERLERAWRYTQLVDAVQRAARARGRHQLTWEQALMRLY